MPVMTECQEITLHGIARLKRTFWWLLMVCIRCILDYVKVMYNYNVLFFPGE